MVIVAFFETMTLGSIAFFASVVTDPKSVQTSKYVAVVKQFIETDFLNSVQGLIIASGLLMCVFVMLKNILKAVVNYCIVRFSSAMEAYFGNILLEGFLRMPYHWHLSANSADLINAIQWRNFLGRSFFLPCLSIFNDVLMISVMLISLFIVQPAVSFAVTLVLGSSAFFIYRVIRQQIDKIAKTARDYQITIHKEAAMSIQGIKDVKICGSERLFTSKYLENAVPLSKIFGLQKFYGDAPVLILETVGFCMLFLSICIMLLKFDITTAYVTGTMALLAVTAWKILPSVSQTLNNLSSIRKSLPYIQTLINYIAQIEANRVGHKNSFKPLSFTKSIKFEDVSFAYEINGQEIIRNMSFNIKKGETLGIIGPSGAGKSTLVDLLVGLLKPIKGRIRIDHQELTDDYITSWLKITGYVPQAPYIYDGTLAENIAFSMDNERIDRSLIWKCCVMASMEDFVNNLPDNIDSFIGERGVKLSGGQHQRVAIARTLYSNPSIIIFDEATSSLDAKNEKSIQETIYGLKGKQTLVIVAHRLSTIKDCDKIIWLEKGQIVMCGDPRKVLEKYKHTMNRKQN